MRHYSRISLLKHSVKALIGVTPKPNVTHINHKDQYYNAYYLPKNLCDGIDMVAAVELTSKKAAAEMLMKQGLSKYMGGKITEFIENEKIARQHNEKVKMTRFVMMLKRRAKERGMDISKLI